MAPLWSLLNSDKSWRPMSTIWWRLHWERRAIRRQSGRVRGVRAVRLERAKAFIVENINRMDLSVRTVAAHVGVGARYLQRLFEEDGSTFCKFLLESGSRGHTGCFRSRYSPRAVSTIAYDVGFGDLSYFHRSFANITVPPRWGSDTPPGKLPGRKPDCAAPTSSRRSARRACSSSLSELVEATLIFLSRSDEMSIGGFCRNRFRHGVGNSARGGFARGSLSFPWIVFAGLSNRFSCRSASFARSRSTSMYRLRNVPSLSAIELDPMHQAQSRAVP